MSFLTTLVVMLFCVNLSQARSIPENCDLEPPSCHDYCMDELYYHSKTTGKCERCISCPEGKEPDKTNPCEAQADGEVVSCVECNEGYYSSEEDQMLCVPCRNCEALHKMIDRECTASNDRICGDCKPGLHEDQYGECVPCEHLTDENDKKNCQRSATTTSKLTTTVTANTTKAPTTTNSISTLGIIETTKTKGSTNEVIKKPTTTVPVAKAVEDHHKNGKELADKTIFQLSVVGGVIVVFAMVTYCIVYYIKSTRNNPDSRKLSGASSAGNSVAAGELTVLASNPKPNTNVTRPLIATNTSNKTLLATSADLNLDNSIAKKCTDKVKIKEKDLDELKFQGKPDGANGAPTKPGSTSTNTSSKKCGRSMSVPAISITPNLLDTSSTNFTRDSNISNTGLKPISSDASSGDESDGLSPVQEDAVLIKTSKPRPKNGKDGGSSTLGVPQRPQRMRRKSLPCHMPSVLPLRSDGGQFSSRSERGSSADLQNTLSAKNSRFSSSVHSLSSQLKSPECNKQRKDRQLRRQHSYENKAMKHNSENEPVETDPLLISDEIQKGTVVTHPEQSGGHYEPAFSEGSYHPFYRMYGVEDPCQVGQNIIEGYPVPKQQYPEPIAKCIPTTAPSASSTSNPPAGSRSNPSTGGKSTPEVPSPAHRPNDFPYRPNSPFAPSSNTQRGQQLPSSEEHLQQAGVVHIYHAPVLQAPVFNSTNSHVKVTICSNNNQIQKQSDLGAGSTKCETDVPKTPEGVECTEPIL